MGIFNFMKKRDTEIPITTPEVNDVLLQALINGEAITKEKAMTLPAVAGAVDFISNMIASMPVKLYRYKNGRIEEVEGDSRTAFLNGDTGDTLDAFQLKKAMVEDYLLDKGGYAYIRRNKNEVTGLFYVEPIRVSLINNYQPIYKDYTIIVEGKMYRPYEFLKLLRKTKNGSEGKGITQELSKALETAYATLLYQLGLVKTGGNKKGFLQAERRLGQEEIDQLKQAWRNMYQNNTENVVVLNNGLKFQESSNSSVEMQLNESKKTLLDEINNIFHIKGDFYETFKEAIYPIVRAFTTALNTSLLLENEKGKYFFEFDVKEIIKANVRERYEAYKIAKETGWLSLNEIRKEENRNYIEGLDVVNVGLGAVLYDFDSHKFYTPNNDTTADLSTEQNIEKVITDKEIDTAFEESGNSAEREIRFNPNHDGKTGKFTFGNGSGGGSYKVLNDNDIDNETKDLQNDSDKIFQELRSEGIIGGVISYSQEYYYDVNYHLRNNAYPDGAYESYKKHVTKITNETEKAINKSTIKENITTFKGTDKKDWDNYKEGEVFSLSFFNSTSVSKKVGNNYSELNENPYMLEIKVPKGAKALYLGKNSANKNEYELLIQKDTKYKVISKENNKMILEIVD